MKATRISPRTPTSAKNPNTPATKVTPGDEPRVKANTAGPTASTATTTNTPPRTVSAAAGPSAIHANTKQPRPTTAAGGNAARSIAPATSVDPTGSRFGVGVAVTRSPPT